MTRFINFHLFPFLLDKFYPNGAADGFGWYALFTLGILSCVIIPYLIGSVNFGILISRIFFHEDVRTHGSGNAGSTNVLRTYGKKYALLTLLGDALKGVVCVFIGTFLMESVTGAPLAGFFVMLGHMFPIYFRFRGGKGIATTFGVILALAPIVALILLTVFLVVFFASHYVSLGSFMCAVLYPMILEAMVGNTGLNVLMAVLAAIFVIFMHRSNIKRLLAGEESKTFLTQKGKETAAQKANAMPENTSKDHNHQKK